VGIDFVSRDHSIMFRDYSVESRDHSMSGAVLDFDIAGVS
jgi:hypothetical protein